MLDQWATVWWHIFGSVLDQRWPNMIICRSINRKMSITSQSDDSRALDSTYMTIRFISHTNVCTISRRKINYTSPCFHDTTLISYASWFIPSVKKTLENPCRLVFNTFLIWAIKCDLIIDDSMLGPCLHICFIISMWALYARESYKSSSFVFGEKREVQIGAEQRRPNDGSDQQNINGLQFCRACSPIECNDNGLWQPQ